PLMPKGADGNDVATFKVEWFAYTRPVASNSTAAGQAQNRRVDIVYPKAVSARGHRQYVQQVVRYTNPSRHITRNVFLAAWGLLESYKEPNADGSILFLGRRPVGGNDASWVETAIARVDEETPLGTWQRWETRSGVTV